MQRKWQWLGSLVAIFWALVFPGKALSLTELKTPSKTPLKTPITTQERRWDKLKENPQKGEFEFEGFEYWADACEVLEGQGDYANALDACETAIELEPNKRETLEVWVRRGNALVGLERHEEAIASYNQVLAARPDYSLVWASQCQVLLGLGRAEDAIAACDRAIQANGSWGSSTPARAWRLRAWGYRQQADAIGNGLETGEELARLFPNRPQDAETRTRQSDRLFAALTEANRSYERAIVLEPGDSLAWAEQCGVLTQLGRVQPGAIEGYPPQPTPAQQYDRAISTCREAISINGDWGDETPAVAWGNWAEAIVARGELEDRFVDKARYFEDAIATYEKALEIDPQHGSRWTQQGRLLQQLGRHEKALISFDRALEVAPDASLALVHRCELLNAIGNRQEALEACDTALEGDNPVRGEAVVRVWNQRAAALVGLGDYEGALASVERALALYDVSDGTAAIPPREDPIERCRRLDLAAISRRDLDGFWDGYRNALNNKAAILWHLKRYPEAQRWAVLALSPESARIQDLGTGRSTLEISCNASSAWFNYGKILRELGNYSQAIEAYNLALKTYGIYRSPQVYSQACNWLLDGGKAKEEKGASPMDGGGVFYALPDRYCANIWVNQSAVLFHQNDYINARLTAQNAARLYPESIGAWYNLALALREERQYREALNAFDRAQQKIAPENGEMTDRILAGRVRTIADWGDLVRQQAQSEPDGNKAQELYRAALNLFDRALQLDPDYLPVQRAQSEVLNAMVQLEIQPVLLNPQNENGKVKR